MSNLTVEEFRLLACSRNQEEWNSICDVIKGTRGGRYPEDWFVRILASGFMRAQQESWNKPSLKE